ncbi:MAG: COX15/CtaA family protein [Planctomycetota bacterium]
MATTIAMFPLIWMGGLVTSKDVGMAVPDWPNTFGYNMWAVPWTHWIGGEAGGVFHEHFHRLLGTVAGFTAVVTVLAAYGAAHAAKARRRWGIAAVVGLGVAVASYGFTKFLSPFSYETNQHLGQLVGLGGAVGVTAFVAWLVRNPPDPRLWVRRLAIGLLVAVCFQGLLGGMRVVLDSTDIAMVHGIFGQLTLCLGGLTALVASRWWQAVEPTRLPRLGWPALTLFVLCVGQLVIAAAMRHEANVHLDTGSGLAIPDFPLHYGEVLPPTNAEDLAAINSYRAFELREPAVRMVDVWLHAIHRVGAYLIAAFTVFVVWRLWSVAKTHALVVTGLVAVQIGLGIATVLLGKPADIATFHVATGAGLLLAVALLSAKQIRRFGLVPQRAETPAEARSFESVPSVAVS